MKSTITIEGPPINAAANHTLDPGTWVKIISVGDRNTSGAKGGDEIYIDSYALCLNDRTLAVIAGKHSGTHLFNEYLVRPLLDHSNIKITLRTH